MAAYKDEERGTWYVSFHYYDWTGKNKRKLKRGFKTRKEALEPGTYLCISKFFDDVVFEYTIVVMEEEFNLSTLTIVEGDKRIEIDFDK